MTVGEKLRKQNKHIRIVLAQKPASSDYKVLQITGTLGPRIGTTLGTKEAQEYINDGYTVIVKPLVR